MEDANDDIAVIGIGCNFPGGEGLDNFWKVLLEGKNCVVDIPPERFDTTFWYDADESKPGKTQTTKAALIEGFNEFDHRFFGITKVEADFMDPQQKLLLQCTYRALEDAGIAMESISGTRTGVYMGLMNRDYEILQSNSPTTISHYNGTGTAMSVAANRISFTFNLTGPSFAVDSACSSSLVVLHLACQAIKQGDCEMALCGGVSCILEPRVFVALSKAKMISPEGTSKPFSSRADGYGRGEGCGVVLLKPLKKAIKDCNRIWGIISKTAVNQDGHSVTPITKPSMTQQEELLRNIYSESDLANVQYIEAHGTGTPVGDPTEAGSISNVIAKAKPPGSEMLWIGSVKGNIGHTESAAGVAGLIKVGIAALLKHWGIKPDAVLGHSVGEVAAAHCSGLLSLEDAVKVLHHRSTLQNKVTGGKMLVVSNVAVEKVLKTLPEFAGQICVAALNSPQSCTLSGDADAIAILHEKLKIMFAEKNLFLHELDVPAAYHSHMMDPILDDIETSINPLYAKDKECKLFSTVTGNCYSDGDFTTGSYWAKNIREPVLFEQALHAVTKDKHSRTNVVFVEIGPRRALQRNIHETLGNNTIVLPSVQPEKDYNTILSTVAKLFELGNSVDWHQLYRGYETLPTEFPVYQFVNTTKELHFEAVIKGNESSAFPPHMLISPIKQDNKEYICNLSLETAPYLWEHKNNGVPIVPGAFFVELAYASAMASLWPKKPVSLLQLSVRFEKLFALSSNSHQLKVTLEPGENGASFKIHSPVATHSSGTYRCTDGQTQLEEPTICLDMIYQRCTLIMKKKEIYSILSQAGFEYGNVFEQLDDVHFGEDFKEAVTAIQVPKELLEHLHDYFIHPVLLDYFLQMTAVVAIGRLTAKQGFPSAISSVAISAPLQENMVMYLRATQETPGFLDVSGGFSNTDGHVLVELIGVRISFLGNCSNGLQSRFFHNEMTSITDKEDLQNSKMKAIVFEDKLGIAKGLRPYLHPESAFVESGEHWMADQIRKLVLDSLKSNVDLENVLFLWGVDDFSHLSPEKMLDRLVTCCELFRQIVLVLKESKRSFTVRVITNRSTEMTVDHVSPGFVLSGMTRSCAAEIAGLSFQLIDLASVTGEDIQMLVCVINTCQHHEVMISNGHASTTRIVRTPMREEVLCEGDMRSGNEDDFVLQTTDPYRMAYLSAVPYDTNASPVQEKSVEIQLTTLCAHSSDYFPVTTSHLNFGKTIYWNKHTSLNHKLLALDFSGIVTAVGKNVYNLRVGDHIASCYPVAATAKIIIPQAVCYSTKKVPILKETPCVSYFILAWEILQRMLSKQTGRAGMFPLFHT
ncbi:hypothetical protein JOQ06_017992 [Pogonophryne albipinna]|uniref:Uncharacterized protein n=1 Tax=Pogonophryne albipinna TaxID=1090488 RepID=A0AAD6F940_9TELE|nr:hypothetical protein JOQ06_017992 [Pogonophryne albipinna]